MTMIDVFWIIWSIIGAYLIGVEIITILAAWKESKW